LKICHIIVGLGVGGAENMLLRLAFDLKANVDCDQLIVSLTGAGSMSERFQSEGIEVQTLGMKSVFGVISVTIRLARILRAYRPDVVQTWMYHADLLGGLAARLAGNRRVIWGIRTTEIATGGSRSTAAVMKACARLSWWVPDSIVCAAEASRRTHVAVGYDAARMVVIPNGFDLASLVATADQRNALREQCGLVASDVVIGTLGRFNPDKDQESFVHAAGMLAQQNAQVRFLLVGRGLDTGNVELASWISQTGHANRFVLLGERDDVPVCLAAMDIFCLSSRTEGFPNVVGEAMAMGLPCVVTDVGDAAMLVSDTGVVVPKENALALAEGVAQVLEMTTYARLQLGQRAKARIRADFTIERAREKFEALYEQVIGRGAR